MFSKGSAVFLAIFAIPLLTFSQKGDWQNLDLKRDKVLGVSADKAHKTFEGKPSKTIIVAVIDSGVDADHEDLRGNMWVNVDEIPNNGIDDDRNGYVDDIHGWNFLGSTNGQNVIADTYGHVREYLDLKQSLQGVDSMALTSEQEIDVAKMQELKRIIDKKVSAATKELESIQGFDETITQVYRILRPYAKSEDLTPELLDEIPEENDRVRAAKSILGQLFQNGFDLQDYREYKDYHYKRIHYHYNVAFDPRSIIGDDPTNPYEQGYGNNDVLGGHAEHGTHVAGIIGATRDNGTGIDGIGKNVQIMALRAVPDGDERDKDVANAIRYAADNGARVINMSFGKGYSPYKAVIDEAVRYAHEKDVLIVHAAGNAGVNIDEAVHFPIRTYKDGSIAANWIEVGATSQKPDQYLLASFTNYGKRELDVFAPGVDLLSTIPDSKYELNSGTSMAAPVVSGIAASIWSYFPQLSAAEVKSIILDSALPYGNLRVRYPSASEDKPGKVKLKKISSTAGIANLYEALILAEERAEDNLYVRKN